MTPEKIIELAQSVGLTLPKRGDYFFINHEDLGKLLVARSEACAKVAFVYDAQPWSHTPAYAHVADMVSIEIGKAIRSMDEQ
jgi:hypothetical protein